MQLLKFEWKKMMYYEKGMVVLALYLILKLLFLILWDTPYYEERLIYGSQYQNYLNQVQGEYTKDKAAYLEAESEKIAQAKETAKTIRDEFYEGNLSETEYKERKKDVSEILKNADGFEAIYEQYLYVCEGKENHYFMDNNGWSGMLSDTHPDILLVLVLILLITPVFCREYETQVDVLIVTSRQGRGSRTQKIFLSVLSGVLAGILGSLTEFVFYNVKYGLPNGGYPLQSVEYFGNSTKPFSLWQAWLWGNAVKLAGCLLFSLGIIFLASLLKKMALSVLTAAAVMILPYFGLPADILVRLPLPVTFFMGADIWKGNRFETDSLTGREILIYRELSGGEMMVLFGAAGALILACILTVEICNRNQYERKRRKSLQKASGFAIGCILLGALTACSRQEDARKGVCYNQKTNQEYRGNEMCVTVPLEGGNPVVEKEDGTTESLVKNPLLEMSGNSGSARNIKDYIFGDERYIYYMEEETERKLDRIVQDNSPVCISRLIRMNQKNCQEKVIFEKDISPGREVLGIGYSTNNKWNFLEYCTGFFVNEDYIFFESRGKIWQVDRRTEEITLLDIPWQDNIAFDGDYIYYLDDESVLCSYYPSAGKMKRCKGIIAASFYLYGDSIYYANRLDGNRLYQYDLENGETQLLVDCPCMSVSVNEGMLCYTDSRDGEEHEIPFPAKP